MSIDYSKIPSPCFVIEEDRFRKNLEIIRHVSEESGAEVILAFKGFSCCVLHRIAGVPLVLDLKRHKVADVGTFRWSGDARL